ncbi:MAG: hypothetical protein ACOCQ4_02950, partial [bacterium]
MPKLENDIDQFFSYSILEKYERVEESNIHFTFNTADIFTELFFSSFQTLENIENETREVQTPINKNLMENAAVFEKFAFTDYPGISKKDSAVLSSGFYWLSGYSANASVIATFLRNQTEIDDLNTLDGFLLNLVDKSSGSFYEMSEIEDSFSKYLFKGNEEALDELITYYAQKRDLALKDISYNDYIKLLLLVGILKQLKDVSFWNYIKSFASSAPEYWEDYVRFQIQQGSLTL